MKSLLIAELLLCNFPDNEFDIIHVVKCLSHRTFNNNYDFEQAQMMENRRLSRL